MFNFFFFYFSNGCNRSTQQANRLGHYLPSYAQCTTNTFLAPSHTHVNHLPASKGKICLSVEYQIIIGQLYRYSAVFNIQCLDCQKMKNWRAKVKPVLTYYLWYRAMLKVQKKCGILKRIYQLTSTAHSAIN